MLVVCSFINSFIKGAVLSDDMDHDSTLKLAN